jgi:hypothetical protein
MATKKQKAELAIQYPEVRAWVLAHTKMMVGFQGGVSPMDLFDIPPPIVSKELFKSKQINNWLNSTKQLYNPDGAVALMHALLDRLDNT